MTGHVSIANKIDFGEGNLDSMSTDLEGTKLDFRTRSFIEIPDRDR